MKKFFVGILIAASVASGYSYRAAVYSGENFSRIEIQAKRNLQRIQCSRFTTFYTPAAYDTPKPIDLINIPVKIAG